jgi:hypothetical protein
MDDKKSNPADFECFDEVAGYLGYDFAVIELRLVINSGTEIHFEEDLSGAFDFDETPQGASFWNKIMTNKWDEGEARMENIVRNFGEGEHSDELPELDEFLGTEADAVDPVMSVEGYDCLRDVLIRAYDQAAKGKGDERHAQGSAFEDQPMQKTIDLYGVGFALGQSAKKAQESMRLPKDRAIIELLGGIVYLAGAIINMEKSE